MDKIVVLENETPKEPKVGEQVLVCDIRTDSEVFQYFLREDAELRKEYNYGLITDESL